MSQDRIDELIHELKALHVREQHILTELEEAHRTQTRDITAEPAQNNRSPTHKLTVSEIIAAAGASDTVPIFQVGDDVVIVNKVRRSGIKQIDNGDRTGVVIKVSQNRVDIRTTNGTFTWRAPKNLRLLINND
jgi:hypothetical protein